MPPLSSAELSRGPILLAYVMLAAVPRASTLPTELYPLALHETVEGASRRQGQSPGPA